MCVATKVPALMKHINGTKAGVSVRWEKVDDIFEKLTRRNCGGARRDPNSRQFSGRSRFTLVMREEMGDLTFSGNENRAPSQS